LRCRAILLTNARVSFSGFALLSFFDFLPPMFRVFSLT